MAIGPKKKVAIAQPHRLRALRLAAQPAAHSTRSQRSNKTALSGLLNTREAYVCRTEVPFAHTHPALFDSRSNLCWSTGVSGW